MLLCLLVWLCRILAPSISYSYISQDNTKLIALFTEEPSYDKHITQTRCSMEFPVIALAENLLILVLKHICIPISIVSFLE